MKISNRPLKKKNNLLRLLKLEIISIWLFSVQIFIIFMLGLTSCDSEAAL